MCSLWAQLWADPFCRHFYFIDFEHYGCNVTYINQVIIMVLFICTYTADKVRNSVLKFWPSELVAITYCTSKVREPVSRFTSRYHFHRRRLLQTLQPARRLDQYYLITQLSWIVLFIMMFEVREDLMYYLWLTACPAIRKKNLDHLYRHLCLMNHRTDWSN